MAHGEEGAWWRAVALGSAGFTALLAGDAATAGRHLAACLPVVAAGGDRFMLPFLLDSCAALAAARQRPERALRLAGAAAALREATGSQAPPPFAALRDRWLAPVERAVSAEARAAWRARERALTEAEAVAKALAATEH